MELIDDRPQPKFLSFSGSGAHLLGIMLVNWLLTLFTLGIYYPWARVNRLKFFWENTELAGSNFVFHGTGKELFKGFIKVILIFIVLYAGVIYAQIAQNAAMSILLSLTLTVAFVFMVPLAVHGALRYRLSRTSWRGIHMGYRGDRRRLVGDFIIGYLLMIITLGIYYSWFISKLRTYIIGNIRFGSLYFGYTGKGSDLFLLNLKGAVLSVLTLGIYFFRYKKEWTNYYTDHCYIEQFGKKYRLNGNFTGMEFFGLIVLNWLAISFTLGLAIPWVAIRNIEFIMNRIAIPSGIDFDKIAQTEDDYRDATGDDLADVLDLGIA